MNDITYNKNVYIQLLLFLIIGKVNITMNLSSQMKVLKPKNLILCFVIYTNLWSIFIFFITLKSGRRKEKMVLCKFVTQTIEIVSL